MTIYANNLRALFNNFKTFMVYSTFSFYLSCFFSHGFRDLLESAHEVFLNAFVFSFDLAFLQSLQRLSVLMPRAGFHLFQVCVHSSIVPLNLAI